MARFWLPSLLHNFICPACCSVPSRPGSSRRASQPKSDKPPAKGLQSQWHGTNPGPLMSTPVIHVIPAIPSRSPLQVIVSCLHAMNAAVVVLSAASSPPDFGSGMHDEHVASALGNLRNPSSAAWDSQSPGLVSLRPYRGGSFGSARTTRSPRCRACLLPRKGASGAGHRRMLAIPARAQSSSCSWDNAPATPQAPSILPFRKIGNPPRT